jgi:hypothetical protein
MMAIGFGFLYTLLRRYAWTGVRVCSVWSFPFLSLSLIRSCPGRILIDVYALPLHVGGT